MFLANSSGLPTWTKLVGLQRPCSAAHQASQGEFQARASSPSRRKPLASCRPRTVKEPHLEIWRSQLFGVAWLLFMLPWSSRTDVCRKPNMERIHLPWSINKHVRQRGCGHPNLSAILGRRSSQKIADVSTHPTGRLFMIWISGLCLLTERKATS